MHIEGIYFSTIIELLQYRAMYQSHKNAFIFLQDGEFESETITYDKLNKQAKIIANHIHQSKVKPGDRVLLLYPSGLDFIKAFLGCLYAGVIAVPVDLPKRNHYGKRIRAVSVDASAEFALTTSSALKKITETIEKDSFWSTLHYLETDTLEHDQLTVHQLPHISADTIAFLQYTSGSTGEPKGVVITHANVLHNLQVLQQAFGHDANTIGVAWLPLFHDMGLIGHVLQPLYLGITSVLMPPVAFLQKPIRWLEAISRYQATTSGGPNFAYDLCIEKIQPETLENLDLSSWKVAFNGSEPVKSSTIDEFTRKFEPFGFCKQAFYPCYGMAESTLFVAGGQSNLPPVTFCIQAASLKTDQVIDAWPSDLGSNKLVSSGHSWLNQKMQIVDPESLKPLPENQVGEIWVSSASVAKGYWNRPEKTKETFAACLMNTSETYLRTGDMGFLKDNEVFVTGRLKDLIIIRGQNYYPQDIEQTVEKSHTSLRSNRGVAISVEIEGKETLVVIQEVKRTHLRKININEVLKSIHRAVWAEHGLVAEKIVLVKPGQIPKTTSGKIQRYSCREKFLANTLKTIGAWERGNLSYEEKSSRTSSIINQSKSKTAVEIEDWLIDIVAVTSSSQRQELLITYFQEQFAEVFQLDMGNILPDENLLTVGLDSIMVMKIINHLSEDIQVRLNPVDIFNRPNISELAKYVAEEFASNNFYSAQETTKIIRDFRSIESLPLTPNGKVDPKALPAPDGQIEWEEEYTEQFPLSWAQERLWFLNQLEGSSATYNMPGAVRISGDLNVSALERTLSEIVSRHEVLHTRFLTEDGTPIQIIDPDATINIKMLDLQQLEYKERETALHQEAKLEAITPFDLEVAPLIRCSLLQLESREYVLLLNMHHIVSDGWSWGVLIRELSSLYSAFVQGESSPLVELPIQYADFTMWQRKWLSGEILENQLNYWKQELVGVPELLKLPTDHPRPVVQTYRGTNQSFTLSADLTPKLKVLSQKSGTTLFMTLQAAFATLMYRYSGQSDIVIGSPIANRNRSEIEPLIGFFVNTLALRTSFEKHLSFEQLLTRVRETTLKAYEYQDVPFEQVVEALQPERSLSHSPLFQVMFTLQNAPMGELELPGVTLTPFTPEIVTTKFDLTVSMTETSSGLVGHWEYSTDLFEGETIERIATNYQNLLEAIVNSPQQAVSEIPILSTAERHQLLTEWNDTEVDYLKDKCIHQLFEEQVKKTPDAVAVVFEEQQLTYQKLNQKANQLAHHLQSLGVKEEVLVGICIERSVEMVVGLLAILKAGGVYVPLDSSYPNERLSHMLSDSNVRVLITQSSLLESLPEHRAKVVCLDADKQAIKQYSQENLETKVSSNNLAYVLYTSGSTGVPKGIGMNHAPLVNLILWQLEQSSAKCGTKTGQFAAISFDVSLQEILSTLCSSGVLVLIPEDVRRDGTELLKLLARQEIERLFLPFVALEQLAQSALDSNSLPFNLRELITAGEQLKITPAIAEFLDKLPKCRLENHYGPTETHVVTSFVLEDLSHDYQLLPPIGRPINNTQIYILDDYLQPVPMGVAGEIYIGGDGLARGYLNRPDLTAEKFIPHPFSEEPGQRLYKTGDLARYLSDGNIEFLGRMDKQVKIRGFRIELGEIESVLNNHPQIRQAVVIAIDNNGGSKRLIAYVVTEDESFSVIQLREFLKQKLPSYMVPSFFIMLDDLPLTPNGKVDRKALPAPDGLIIREQEYIAPRNTVEQILVKIWQELLGVQKVSIHDNFFELGGDSLLAIQVVNKAKRHDQVLQLKQIFQHQTIAELASMVNTTEVVKAQQSLVKGIAPLLPRQKDMFENIEVSQLNLSYLHGKLYDTQNSLDPELLKKAVLKLFIHHDALRMRFIKTHQGWQQINAEVEDHIIFHQFDLSQLSVEKQKRKITDIAKNIRHTINIYTGPLVKVIFLKLRENQDDKVLFIFHHLITDVISMEILWEDLSTIYPQLNSGKLIKFPPKSTSVKFWATRLTEYAHSENIQKERAYWLEMCRKYDYRLPIDNLEDENDKLDMWTQPIMTSLNSAETRILLNDITSLYNTRLTDLLIAALVQTFMHWSGKSYLLMRILSHGRHSIFEDIDLSRTVGWLAMDFPILFNIEGTKSIKDTLKKIKEQLVQIPNYGIGYSALRYMSQDKSFLKELKTFIEPEVYFNFQGQHTDNYSEDILFTPSKQVINVSDYNVPTKEKRIIKVRALILNGSLKIFWHTSGKYNKRSTIKYLSQEYIKILQDYIDNLSTGQKLGSIPIKSYQKNLLGNTSSHLNLLNINALFIEYPQWSDPYLFEKSLKELTAHHDALRIRFIQIHDSWKQIIAEIEENKIFYFKDLSEVSPENKHQKIIEFAEELQNGINISNGPLFKVAFFKLGAKQQNKIVFIISHLVYDLISIHILIEDLQSVYQQLSCNKAIKLPPKTTSYKFWMERLMEYSKSESLLKEREYWLETHQKYDYKLPLNWSKEASERKIVSFIQPVVTSLSVEETEILLKKITAKYHIRFTDILLTALVKAFMKWTGKPYLLINFTNHGRYPIFEDVDLSRSVGFFARYFPLLLNIGESKSIEDELKHVRQQLSKIPNYGIGYSTLRDFSDDIEFIEKLRSLSKPEVKFNYGGHYAQDYSNSPLITSAYEAIKIKRPVINTDSKRININLSIKNKHLQMKWWIINDDSQRLTIKKLAHNYVQALQSFVYGIAE